MSARIRVIPNPKLCYLTPELLSEVAANLTIELTCDVRLVTFATLPPPDTSLPWAQLDECSGNPVGRIKTFQNGEWK